MTKAKMTREEYKESFKTKKAATESKPILNYFKRNVAKRIGIDKADICSELMQLINWILSGKRFDGYEEKGLSYFRLSLNVLAGQWGMSTYVLRNKIEKLKKSKLLFYISPPWIKGGKSFYISFNVPLLYELLDCESIAKIKNESLGAQFIINSLDLHLNLNSFNIKLFNLKWEGKDDTEIEKEIVNKLNNKEVPVCARKSANANEQGARRIARTSKIKSKPKAEGVKKMDKDLQVILEKDFNDLNEEEKIIRMNTPMEDEEHETSGMELTNRYDDPNYGVAEEYQDER